MQLPLRPLRFTSTVEHPTRAGEAFDVATDGSYCAIFGVSADELPRRLKRGAELRAGGKAKRIAHADRFRREEFLRRLKILAKRSCPTAPHWELCWERAARKAAMDATEENFGSVVGEEANRIREMLHELLGMWTEPGCTKPGPGELLAAECTAVERAVIFERIKHAQDVERGWRSQHSLADDDNDGVLLDKRTRAFTLRDRALKPDGKDPEWVLSALSESMDPSAPYATPVPKGLNMARQLNRALVVLRPFGYPDAPQLVHSVENGVPQGPLHPGAQSLLLDIVNEHLKHTAMLYEHVSAQRTYEDAPYVVRFPTGGHAPNPRIEVDSPDAQLSAWLQLLTRGCAPYTAHGEALRFDVDRAYTYNGSINAVLLRMAIGDRVCITFGLDWGVFELFMRRLLHSIVGGPTIGYDDDVWLSVADRAEPDLSTFQLAADRVCAALNRKLRRCDPAAKDAAIPLVAFRAALLTTWRCTSDRGDRTAKKRSISAARKGYSMLARRHNVQLRDATHDEAAAARRTRGMRLNEGVCVRIDPPREFVCAYDPTVQAFCEGRGWKHCQCSRGCVFRRGRGRLVGEGQTSLDGYLR